MHQTRRFFGKRLKPPRSQRPSLPVRRPALRQPEAVSVRGPAWWVGLPRPAFVLEVEQRDRERRQPMRWKD